MMRPRYLSPYSPAEEKHYEQARALNKEAHVLLDLIAAEFASDPMSTQCFDLRVVERVRMLVAQRKAWEKKEAELCRL